MPDKKLAYTIEHFHDILIAEYFYEKKQQILIQKTYQFTNI